MKSYLDAFNAMVDARLEELGLYVKDEKSKSTKAVTPAAKGGKGGKGAEGDDLLDEGKGGKDEPDEITYDTLKEKLVEVVNSKGKNAAKALLKKYKAETLSEVNEKHYAKLDADLDKESGDADDLLS